MGYLKVANDKISDWLLQAVIIKFFEAKKLTSINVILLHFGEKNNLAEGLMELDLRKVICN